ncbi:MAG: hypothetical protein K2Q26_00590 [Bdellovibrionales bacterium]|nr:hypothetical protein [Bdellovibrionales bacterium]
MTYSQNDSTCFVKLQDNVTLEKIPRAQTSTNNEFSRLSVATADRQNYWNQKERGGPLMGLTIFSFVETDRAQELKHTAILVTDTVRPWHLWHEFSHHLVGKSRLSQPHRRFTAPTPKQLGEARENLERVSRQVLASSDSTRMEEFSGQIKAYVDLVFRDLDFNYVHEIVIELTLTELALQLPKDRITNVDFLESSHMTETNLNLYLQKWHKTKEELLSTLRPHFSQPEIRSTWLSSAQRVETYGRQLEQYVRRQHHIVYGQL